MNVLFVSQCSGKALKETRRILDQYGERCGDRVWQTPITEDGLAVVARLLRKTARRNTAVACHWLRGRNCRELLWIIGDRRRFSATGAVPTNVTRRRVLFPEDNDWHTREWCLLLTAMAALWHDVGKIGKAFQEKLLQGPNTADAFRHEWLSLRLFQAFVGDAETDEDWLIRLASLEKADLMSMAKAWLKKVCQDENASAGCAIGKMPPLARAIAWLMLGHHRLPVKKARETTRNTDISSPLGSITPDWGYTHEFDRKSLKKTWKIEERHLPCFSRLWRGRAAKIAHKLLERLPREDVKGLLDNTYLVHVARLGLMLADHVYSSLRDPEKRLCGDSAYEPYANSDRRTGQPCQKLDEHLAGVERLSSLILWRLGRLHPMLPAVGLLSSRRFRRRSEDARFRWQDKAFDLAASLAERSAEQGFFGINMASTGCGKTLANGRICSALAGEGKLRFTVALGLRTLTFQTGEAYRSRLGLGRDELAVLAGDQAVRDLYERREKPDSEEGETPKDDGSESGEALFQGEVQYGDVPDGSLAQWLAANPGAAALVSAPVLACTIDHLVPATEGIRGGRQIAPMLRLMTSDLVLDEPDDFDIDDIHALSRLVFWAGMLGSRVILSSATLTPSFAQGLFSAYQKGREQFCRNRGNRSSLPVICAWFDEFACQSGEADNGETFAELHGAFAEKRLRRLEQQEIRRKPVIWNLDDAPDAKDERMAFWTERIREAVTQMHDAHHATDAATGKRISFGLVRMANIDPLVRTAQHLARAGAADGAHWHICCYHSRYPMLMRSALEHQLDRLLTRKLPDAEFLRQPSVQRLLARSPVQDHIVIVLATSVAEVGRDHDYDWAVVEPSSMRSLIQLAGRVRRHRAGAPAGENICLLDRNWKALELEKGNGKFAPAYRHPGFESDTFRLGAHDLTSLLTPEQLARLDAGARVMERRQLDVRVSGQDCRVVGNLADLEHAVLREVMLERDEKAGGGLLRNIGIWWQGQATLTGEAQRLTRFRSQEPSETCLWAPDEGEETWVFSRLEEDGTLTRQQKMCRLDGMILPDTVSWLNESEYGDQLRLLAGENDISLEDCARRYGRVELPVRNDILIWHYHPRLGFFQQD